MFFLRITFLTGLALLFLPNIEPSAQRSTAATPFETASLQPAEELLPDIQQICDEHPQACQIASWATHKLHRQAIGATGLLHSWLSEKLEDRENDKSL